ncbi:unnamed protein product [Protopolystoma xenopodis]|uniref:Uncharacterized protein n=1 Tax=Protopolystoma xenopodis TaxID=117903 RepID=A0A448XCF1_9PLAT|nr:unnamed protein product [Protopolystoma xenopodis]
MGKLNSRPRRDREAAHQLGLSETACPGHRDPNHSGTTWRFLIGYMIPFIVSFGGTTTHFRNAGTEDFKGKYHKIKAHQRIHANDSPRRRVRLCEDYSESRWVGKCRLVRGRWAGLQMRLSLRLGGAYDREASTSGKASSAGSGKD